MFLQALRAEIEVLEGELLLDVRYRKLRELQQVRRLYDPEEATPAEERTLGVSSVRGGTVRVHRVNTERVRALDAARMFIVNRVGPVPTTDVLEHLSSMGIQIGGNEPRNTLSAMMSNSELFTSNGRKGWTIRQEGDPAERPDNDRSDPAEDRSPAPALAVADRFITMGSGLRRAPPPPKAEEEDDIPF